MRTYLRQQTGVCADTMEVRVRLLSGTNGLRKSSGNGNFLRVETKATGCDALTREVAVEVARPVVFMLFIMGVRASRITIETPYDRASKSLHIPMRGRRGAPLKAWHCYCAQAQLGGGK